MERERRRRILRIAGLAALGILVLFVVVRLDQIFLPLLFALLVAYILNPLVDRIQGLGIPRSLAIVVLFLVFYACLTGFFLVTVPAFGAQVQNLWQNTVGERTISKSEWEKLPAEEQRRWEDLSAADKARFKAMAAEETKRGERTGRGRPVTAPPDKYIDSNRNGRYDEGYVRKLAQYIEHLKTQKHPSALKSALAEGLEELRDYLVANRRHVVLSALHSIVGVLFTAFGILTMFVLVPIYLFYFLMGLSGTWSRVRAYLPGRHRDRLLHVCSRIDESVSAFFRGRLIVMVIKAAIAALALLAVGLPYALFLGVVSGIGSLIPIAGFLIGSLLGVGIALLDVGSPGLALGVAAIYAAIEIFENYFLSPWILKDRVGLHPVTIVVSVFVAGELFGFIGMLLSVPLASVAKILFEEYVKPEIAALAAEHPISKE